MKKYLCLVQHNPAHIIREKTTWHAFAMAAILYVMSGLFSSVKAVSLDHLRIYPDSTLRDSLKIRKPKKDSLDAPIKYNADDSMKFDIRQKKVYLHHHARVTYKDINLTAEYIEFDWGNNVVTAYGIRDSLGKRIGKPVFKQGSDEYESDTIRYNFKTQKGKISDLITQEGEGFIHSDQVKKLPNDDLYARNALYTTCDYEHPDFYIRSSKLKIVKDKVIVSGPANLVIADVPTPLFIPFGIFPIKKGKTSGIEFPEYGEDKQLGFFLRNGGYYFALGDHLDLKLLGDIYSRGTWRLSATTDYAVRYKYNGAFFISYAKTRLFEDESLVPAIQNDFRVRWDFNQLGTHHPAGSFRVHVDAGSSGYNKTYGVSYGTYLNNTYTSSIAYQKDFKGTPFHLALNLGHTQNTSIHSVDFTLPSGSLTMDRITPFKRRNQVGDVRWYEKIGITYHADFENLLHATDSLLLDSMKQSGYLGRNFRNGIHQSIPLSTSFQLFRYINVSPSINYNGYFYFKTIRKNWDPAAEKLDTTIINGFAQAHTLDGNLALSTKIYTMYSFKKGRLKAIRHVITPTISADYHPDYSEAKYGYYYTTQTDTIGTRRTYSIFDEGLYRGPVSGKSGTISFGFDNNLEMKVFSRKDTVNHTKKITLLDGLGIFGGYNPFADSLKVQDITINARTNLLNRFNLSANAALTPYDETVDGYKINTFLINKTGKVLSLENANMSFTTAFGSKQKKYPATGKTKDETEMINKNPDAYVDFNIPWKLNIGYNINIQHRNASTGDTSIFTQTLHAEGEINLTENWKVSFQTNYDFAHHQFSYTTLEIYRDLHCWEMSFQWVPFGIRQSYSFDLRVKSSVLQSLKVSKRKSWNEYY